MTDRETAALVERNLPMALAAIRGLYVPGLDREDIEQEVRIAILDAVGRCTPGVNVAPLACVAARRRILTLIQAQQRRRRAAHHDAVSLSLIVDDDVTLADMLEDRREPGPEARLLWREQVHALAAVPLTDRERRAVFGLAAGLSYAEIEGKRTGVTPRWIDNAAQRARRKLRAAA